MADSFTSLDKFNEAIQLAENLYAIDKDKYGNPPRSADQPAVQGLRGGAAVLSVAAFEMYLRDLFSKQLSRLNGTPPPVKFDKLPNKLKENAVYSALELAMKGSKYEQQKSKTDRLPDIFRVFATLNYGAINPLSFSDTGSNPSPETVKRMFKNIALNNVFNDIKTDFDNVWGQSTASTFIEDKLKEIVNRRHIVAHTADALNISRSDLLETFRFLKILAKLLEDKLSAYIDKLRITCV